MARRPMKQQFKYECSLTGEVFTRTAKAANPSELLNVNAYYELNPEEDDRSQATKNLSKVALKEEEQSLESSELDKENEDDEK